MTEYHGDSKCGSCKGPLEVQRDAICETCVPDPEWGTAMSDEIRIPESVLVEGFSISEESSWNKGAQYIARWMREECAKEAEKWTRIPAVQVVADAIRKVGTQ